MCSCPRTRTRKSVALLVPGNLRPRAKLAVLRPDDLTHPPSGCQERQHRRRPRNGYGWVCHDYLQEAAYEPLC